MKKLIALIMALTMIATFAACGTTENEKKDPVETTEASENTDITENAGPKKEAESANDIMTDVWAAIPQDQKPAVIGGHYSQQYTEGPATYDLQYAEELGTMLLIPEEQLPYVVDASTAVHMMNANSMTIGVVKLSEGAIVEEFTQDVYDTITNNQWMCGFPEKLIISQVNGEYILIAYGLTDLLDTFKAQLDTDWQTSDFFNEAIV